VYFRKIVKSVNGVNRESKRKKMTHIKLLLLITAVIELIAGIVMLLIPSQATLLLLGTSLDSPASILIGRLAGSALFAIGIICWLQQKNQIGRQEISAICGVLAYNISIPLLLSYAYFYENLSGILLWPAVGLHLALTIWCILALRNPVKNEGT
jgi:hypothetical protein